MKQIQFSFNQCGVTADRLQKIGEQLTPEIDRIKAAWHTGYKTNYASLSTLFDTTMQQEVADLVAEKKALNPTLMIVIGSGGSSLGTLAVQQAIHGVLYNVHPSMQVYFADSVDTTFTKSVYERAKKELTDNKNILLVIISKSGTTTETIANAQLFTALVAEHTSNFQDYIVVISDKDSPLWDTAHQHKIARLAVPEKVGGRFSLFSPVGLFPLSMLGIECDELIAGAASVQKITAQFEHNPAAISAAILYEQYQKGFMIHDSFFFVKRLEAVGLWYRQLMGESIGKSHDQNNKKVNVGITPTVSIGSADLHSVAQLYLAGPNNRVTTFITSKIYNTMMVPAGTPFQSLVPMIEGKNFAEIMEAIVGGVEKAYADRHRPYMKVELPEISAYYIGQFMQLKMIEIMYLGALFAINPFNQPQVELYKKETRKILSHE